MGPSKLPQSVNHIFYSVAVSDPQYQFYPYLKRSRYPNECSIDIQNLLLVYNLTCISTQKHKTQNNLNMKDPSPSHMRGHFATIGLNILSSI